MKTKKKMKNAKPQTGFHHVRNYKHSLGSKMDTQSILIYTDVAHSLSDELEIQFGAWCLSSAKRFVFMVTCNDVVHSQRNCFTSKYRVEENKRNRHRAPKKSQDEKQTGGMAYLYELS